MDKKYIELFKELTRATAVAAEQVMDYDKAQNNENGFNTAKTIRDDFESLYNRLDEEYKMNKADAAKLLIGTMIQSNQLQDRIQSLKKAMTGYQTDLIPKLQEIIDNAGTDEEVAEMANKKFIIENNE